MLRKKKKQNGAFHALSIGETQGKEVCYRRRHGKKKGETRHNTQKQPTNPPKTCTHSLSTGEESTVGQIERYVFRVTHTTHFCYTSTGPLLLLFSFCFLNTTMPTDDENQPRHDTPHQPHTASTHTHTHGSHTAHDPPHATHTNTKGHTAHTHTLRPRRRAPRAPATTTSGP